MGWSCKGQLAKRSCWARCGVQEQGRPGGESGLQPGEGPLRRTGPRARPHFQTATRAWHCPLALPAAPLCPSPRPT